MNCDLDLQLLSRFHRDLREPLERYQMIVDPEKQVHYMFCNQILTNINIFLLLIAAIPNEAIIYLKIINNEHIFYTMECQEIKVNPIIQIKYIYK